MKKRFVNLVQVFPASIKSVNSIQKYSHIIESYACILKTFVVMFLLPINVLTSFGMYSTLKPSKLVKSLFHTYKAIQWVPISEYSLRFIIYAASFISAELRSVELCLARFILIIFFYFIIS